MDTLGFTCRPKRGVELLQAARKAGTPCRCGCRWGCDAAKQDGAFSFKKVHSSPTLINGFFRVEIGGGRKGHEAGVLLSYPFPLVCDVFLHVTFIFCWGFKTVAISSFR